MTARGTSRKGAERRQQIIDKTIEFLERDGYTTLSVREIARATGLSQPGLLHYFPTKEELIVAVFQRRERELDDIEGDAVDVLLTVIDGIRNPELERFFLIASVEGTVHAHPGREFFQRRYVSLRGEIAAAIRERQRLGTFPSDRDPEFAAMSLISFADGVQIQWLLDPSIDMGARLRQLWSVLTGAEHAP